MTKQWRYAFGALSGEGTWPFGFPSIFVNLVLSIVLGAKIMNLSVPDERRRRRFLSRILWAFNGQFNRNSAQMAFCKKH